MFIVAISLLIALGFVIGLIFLYISSRMRFVLFDAVVAGECRIRQSWNRRGEPAFRYFLWQIGYTFIGLLIGGLIIGVPILLALRVGLFQNPTSHLAVLILGGTVIFFAGLVWFVVFASGVVLTKDFVVPQMALENVSATVGWRRLWEMMKAEKGGYAGYIGMKVVLAIAAGIILGIIGLLVLLVLLIPVGGFGIFAVLGGRAAGLTWNPLTIALAIVCGLLILLGLIFISAMLSVPAIVFFPAYSIYFFADRYAPLRAAMVSAGPLPENPLPSPGV
jgi:hypothetical protein